MAEFSREELLAEKARRASMSGMMAHEFSKEELLAEKARREQENEGWGDYAARKTGRGLRHASVAINSVKDLPRNIIDLGAKLVTNDWDKSLFDPKESYVHEGLDRIDRTTNNKLKARTKGEEYGDSIIPAVLPVGVGGLLNKVVKSVPLAVGAGSGAALGKKIQDSKDDEDSAFYGLSPRQAIVLQSLVGGAGLYAVKGASKGLSNRMGKNLDHDALVSLDTVNQVLATEGLPPIKSSLVPATGAASHGHAKSRHQSLEKIIKGEDTSDLASFFDKSGLREGTSSYITTHRPHQSKPRTDLDGDVGNGGYPVIHMPKKAVVSAPEKGTTVSTASPASRMTQADKDLIAAFEKTDAGQSFRDTPRGVPLDKDVPYSGSTFSGNGRGVSIGESNASGPYIAKTFDAYEPKGKHPWDATVNLRQSKPKVSSEQMEGLAKIAQREGTITAPHLPKPDLTKLSKSDVGPAFYEAQAEFANVHPPKTSTSVSTELPNIVSPRKVMKQKNEDIVWRRDPTESIEFDNFSRTLEGPHSAAAIRKFANSLPTVEARADGARALINHLSPDGNWLEIVAKYQRLPSAAKKEILGMFRPSERDKFAGAMHYAGRTLPNLQKEATKRVAKSNEITGMDIALGIATHGLSPLVKSIAKKAEGPSRNLLNDFFHSKGLSEFARKSRREAHASGGDVRALAAKGRGGDTEVAYIGQKTASVLDNVIHGGKRQFNPKTGMREYCKYGLPGCNEQKPHEHKYNEIQIIEYLKKLSPDLRNEINENVSDTLSRIPEQKDNIYSALMSNLEQDWPFLKKKSEEEYATKDMSKMFGIPKNHANNLINARDNMRTMMNTTTVPNSDKKIVQKYINHKLAEIDPNNFNIDYGTVINLMHESYKDVPEKKGNKVALKEFNQPGTIQFGKSCTTNSGLRALKHVEGKYDHKNIPDDQDIEKISETKRSNIQNNIFNKNAKEFERNKLLKDINNKDTSKYENNPEILAQIEEYYKDPDKLRADTEYSDELVNFAKHAATHHKINKKSNGKLLDKYMDSHQYKTRNLYKEKNKWPTFDWGMKEAKKSLENNTPVFVSTHESVPQPDGEESGNHVTTLISAKDLDTDRYKAKQSARENFTEEIKLLKKNPAFENDKFLKNLYTDISFKQDAAQSILDNNIAHKLEVSDSNFTDPRKIYLQRQNPKIFDRNSVSKIEPKMLSGNNVNQKSIYKIKSVEKKGNM